MMIFTLDIFAGRSKHGLGTNEFYRSSLCGAEVERCHAHACDVLGLDWGACYEHEHELTEDQAAALRKIPALAADLDLDAEDGSRAFCNLSWAAVYLEVASYGATLLGLELHTKSIDAWSIDAKGEVFGYVG